MRLSKGKIEEFNNLSKQLIDFLNANCHPHVSVIIDSTHSEILEGIAAYSVKSDDNKARVAAEKVLRGKGSSKAVKTARGSALSQK